MVGGKDRLDGKYDGAESHYRVSLSMARQHDLPIMATALYAFADLALARGQHTRALRLAGASDALSARLGEDKSMEMSMIGDVRAAATSFMGKVAADSIYEEGRAMELHDAVEYALGQEGA
jgi:hypothetical protein